MARRNLANRLRAELALKRREARYASDQVVRLRSDPDITRLSIDLWASIVEVTNGPRERRAAALWLDDSENDVIAEALGTRHLPAPEQAHEVRRFKERLMKRLSRHFRTPSGLG